MVRRFLILSLVCLLMVGWMPVVEATSYYYPTEEYIVASKGTRVSGGFPGNLYYAEGADINYRTEDDAVNSYLDVRMNFTDAPQWPYLYQLRIKFKSFDHSATLTCNPCFGLYVYDGSSWNLRVSNLLNDTWKEARYTLTTNEAKVIDGPQIRFYWEDATVGPYNLYLDQVVLVDYMQEQYDKIEDLEKKIADLEQELEKYKQDQGVPDVIKTGNLPFVPVGSRGPILPQGYFEIDPYLAYSYIAADNNTGNDFVLNRVWNAAETDYMTLSDEWFIVDGYTTLYVNQTLNTTSEADDVALTDWDGITETRSYHWTDYAHNLSVETDSAGSVKFNRVANIQVINTFSWGESSLTGAFITQSTIENDCSMDWRYINVYWAFPEEDSDGTYVEVDTSSIVVTDDDNNLELERGQHWTTDVGGLYLAFQYLNASDDRTFTVEFNRRLAEEGDIVSIITDGDVEFTNTMRTYPFEFDVWYGIVSNRQFNGKWIIKFDFSREHANKHLGRTIVYVNGGFTSDFVIYSDRMEIYDLTFEAGSSNQIRVLFDWKSGESDIYNWGTANLLALVCIGIFAIIVGAKWYRQHTETKNRMYKFLAVLLIVLGTFALGVFGMLLF